MLDQQQALAVLAAMDAADIGALFALIPFDGRDEIAHPRDGSTVIVGYVGSFGVAYSDFSGLSLHEHPTADIARECHNRKVAELRALSAMASMVPTFDQIRSLPETPDVRYI